MHLSQKQKLREREVKRMRVIGIVIGIVSRMRGRLVGMVGKVSMDDVMVVELVLHMNGGRDRMGREVFVILAG